jgi:HNH endonuclease
MDIWPAICASVWPWTTRVISSRSRGLSACRPGAAAGGPRALSPSIDHIVAVSRGGAHTRHNVRITHLWCNTERNNGTPRSPELMRAQLRRLLDGTPIPEALHRSASPSWHWPASPRIEYMIALYIAAGLVAADPRYGNPDTRLTDTVRHRSRAHAEAKKDRIPGRSEELHSKGCSKRSRLPERAGDFTPV